MRYVLVALLLTACSQAPLSIPVADSSTDIALITGSSIVFQKANQTQNPPTPVKSIALEGTATYKTENSVFEFFASDGVPCNNQVGSVYICSPNASLESLGQTDFSSGASQSFRWSGTKLTDGTNKGTLYLGVRLKSGTLSSGTLRFSNMVAKVAIL